MLRYILAVACCVTLTAGDLSQLRQLEEKHRIFDLRDLLEQPGGNTAEAQVYRAIATSCLGREREAVSQFRTILRTKLVPGVEREVHYEMSSALTRLGEYGDAASELAAALRLTGGDETGRAGSENALALLKSLSGVPAQTVDFGPPAPIQTRSNGIGWVVPVEIDSQRGEWILDTGANFSTVTESEARRMGLTIREAYGYVRGITQAKNPARLAVARELRFGSARLHNVVFLVLADQALFISQFKVQIHGILGLPAMRALGCVDLSSKGALTIDCGAKPPQGRPNVFFDGLEAIVQVVHSGHNLQMMLDTGTRTVLFSSARDAFADWERYQLTGTRVEGLSGAGGSRQVQASMVPSIQFEIQGRTFHLQRISLLSQQPAGSSGLRDGIVGADALAGGFRLDFRAMQFTLN